MIPDSQFTLKIVFTAPVITPLQADTLFGHFCWMLNYIDPDRLKTFLKLYEERSKPPMLISNGIPAGFMPKPIIPPLAQDLLDLEVGREDRILASYKIKHIKEMTLITYRHFKRLQENIITPIGLFKGMMADYEELAMAERRERIQHVMHNTIDRCTGRIRTGALYGHDERFFTSSRSSAGAFNVYIHTDFFKRDELLKIFRLMGERGYGKNSSTGKGHFNASIEEGLKLPLCSAPNGFMTLSNFIPTSSDPSSGYYQVLHKFGKLGGPYACGAPESMGKPFKTPLIMIAAGSTFLDDNFGPQCSYGSLLENIHPNPQIRHYAYAFPLGIRLAEVES